MALITCPNCQRKVSDTAEKCIHCGCNLAKPKAGNEIGITEERNYQKLTLTEQNNLKNEFYSVFPKYGAFNKKQDRFYKSITITQIVSGLAFVCFIIMVIAFRVYRSATKNTVPIILSIPLFTLLAVWLIVGLVCWFLILVPQRKYKRNEMIVEKKFQRWLKDEKNIVYTVNFTKKMQKYKKFFDSVNVDRQDIE